MNFFKSGDPKKSQLLSIFLKSVLGTTLFCTIILGGVVWAYQSYIYTNNSGGDIQVAHEDFSYYKNEDGESAILADEEEAALNKTVAVFGTDADGYRTDTIIIVNLNTATNEIKMVNIPRDTKVSWTDAQREAMTAARGYSMVESKINEMTAYVGIDNIRDFTIRQIELILGVKIDNYVVVSTSAFRDIVDAIGGVEVDVPFNMRYTDNYQGLYINISAGLQVLDGENAEKYMRYRAGNSDLDRMGWQQLFIEAFIDKVLSPSIITKIPELVSVMFNSVKTDASLAEVFSYYDYITYFDPDNVSFSVIPGEALYIGGVSYFIPDMNSMADFVNETFYSRLILSKDNDKTDADLEEEIEELEPEIIINKDLTMQVLNATNVSGAASTYKSILEDSGYTVANIGNYTGASISTTQIRVQEYANGEQFVEFFTNPEIIEDQNLVYDVQILLKEN
ncbi:MAG: hypothetical protein ATN35_11425 [Epulopiscium sp. Nele67-Bin004]|nr:MAG: hypothetical protein ATN35_11425 [Epulopiscium sp. Nele67-Bin004]